MQAGGHRFDSDILHGRAEEEEKKKRKKTRKGQPEGFGLNFSERITAKGSDWIATSLIINHLPLTIIDDVDPGDRVER